MLTTQQASEMTGISKRSLQYYDDLQLIHVPRDANNHRMFDEETMERIWKILWYKEMGFTLQEIKQILNMDSKNRIQEIHKKLDVLEESILQQQKDRNLFLFILDHGVPVIPKDPSTTYCKEIINMKEKVNK